MLSRGGTPVFGVGVTFGLKGGQMSYTLERSGICRSLVESLLWSFITTAVHKFQATSARWTTDYGNDVTVGLLTTGNSESGGTMTGRACVTKSRTVAQRV